MSERRIAEGPLWVVATRSAAERWAAELRARGEQPHVLAWGRARPLAARHDLAGALERSRPDLVLLTSAEALAFLGEGVVDGLRAACVGPATGSAATARGFEVVAEGQGGAEHLALALQELESPPRRVLWLRGRDARSEGGDVLRAAGAVVTELMTYEIQREPEFDPALRAAPEPGAIALGSPRGAEALIEGLARVGRTVPAQVRLLVSGATTGRRVEELGWGTHPQVGLWSVIVGRNVATYHPRIGDERGPRPHRDA